MHDSGYFVENMTKLYCKANGQAFPFTPPRIEPVNLRNNGGGGMMKYLRRDNSPPLIYR